MTANRFYIYAYFDPVLQVPIYIGRGTRRRAWHHLHRTDTHHPLTARIQALRAQGVQPVVTILITRLTNEQANAYEVELIRIIGRGSAGPLLNLTNGGGGSAGCVQSEETKARRRRNLSGRPRSPEARAALSAGWKARRERLAALST